MAGGAALEGSNPCRKPSLATNTPASDFSDRFGGVFPDWFYFLVEVDTMYIFFFGVSFVLVSLVSVSRDCFVILLVVSLVVCVYSRFLCLYTVCVLLSVFVRHTRFCVGSIFLYSLRPPPFTPDQLCFSSSSPTVSFDGVGDRRRSFF